MAEIIGSLRPSLRPEAGERILLGERIERQELYPRRLLGAELSQPQLAPVGDPDEQSRGAVTRAGRPIEELQAAGGHQVQQQRQLAADLDDDLLAAAAHDVDLPARQRVERRREALQGVDSGRARRVDLLAAQRGVQTADGDLDLGKLGHRSSVRLGPGRNRASAALDGTRVAPRCQRSGVGEVVV